MDDNSTRLFIFLIFFWTLLTIFGNVFEHSLSTRITEYTLQDTNVELNQNFVEKTINLFTNTMENVPLLNKFVPLFRIMTFQYSENVPVLVTIFLDGLGVLTAFIVLQMIKN